jgi:uncharacterized membrane protein YdjX (TVP38/TMEM64 family)
MSRSLVVSLPFSCALHDEYPHWHFDLGLDMLSMWLREIGFPGFLILYLCILLTTIPPLPLYSTLIILSGYAFGTLRGFLVS